MVRISTRALVAAVLLALIVAIGATGTAMARNPVTDAKWPGTLTPSVSGPDEVVVGQTATWTVALENTGIWPSQTGRGCDHLWMQWGDQQILDSNGNSIGMHSGYPWGSCHGYGQETLWPGKKWTRQVLWNGTVPEAIVDYPEEVTWLDVEPGQYTLRTGVRLYLAEGPFETHYVEQPITVLPRPA